MLRWCFDGCTSPIGRPNTWTRPPGAWPICISALNSFGLRGGHPKGVLDDQYQYRPILSLAFPDTAQEAIDQHIASLALARAEGREHETPRAQMVVQWNALCTQHKTWVERFQTIIQLDGDVAQHSLCLLTTSAPNIYALGLAVGAFGMATGALPTPKPSIDH